MVKIDPYLSRIDDDNWLNWAIGSVFRNILCKKDPSLAETYRQGRNDKQTNCIDNVHPFKYFSKHHLLIDVNEVKLERNRRTDMFSV
jgi:hypothetical protein